ncbi:hypothetical protein D6C76_10765, partial [Aureobasidium pullulans]
LKVRIAYERAYFLYYLDAAKYNSNSYVSNVRLYKDANKVKRSLLTIATFREKSSSDSEGSDAPSPNSATSAVTITAASS